MKALSLEDIALWQEQAKKIPWFEPWKDVFDGKTWFCGGFLNASHVCLDAHILNGHGLHTAIIWENELGDTQRVSYQELYELTNQIAYNLQKLGVKKGEPVVVYLPMIPEAVATILAIARLGAVNVVVFSGFGAQALQERIVHVGAQLVITTDFDIRRGKKINLRGIVETAVQAHSNVRIFDIGELKKSSEAGVSQAYYLPPVPVASDHPLFILYTSGSTGKPKKIVHGTGGYLTYVYSTIQWAFDISRDSIYWCTADIGWVTGHSYGIFGPLSHGATMVMYDGAPDTPSSDIWWRIIERHKVTVFYSSPTALRFFMKLGLSVRFGDLSSLRVLGSVGEPLNPQVWQWYHTVIGGGRCPIVDTWWQTETGGFMIAPAAGIALDVAKPGSVAKPLPGVEMDIVDDHGNSVALNTKGFLVVTKPWPGMHLGIDVAGVYRCGDYAIKDRDGDYWMLGRSDEVLNIAGHRVGTAEIESAMLHHAAVAEVAAIAVADEVKGEGVEVFVVLREIVSHEIVCLEKELVACVHAHIGKFVTPSAIHSIAKLPKTRSGKIMRRVLKAMIEGRDLGDLSTLEDGEAIDEALAVYRDFLARRKQAR